MPTRRLVPHAAALVLLTLVLSGCNGDPPPPAPSSPSPDVALEFTYVPDSGDQGLDEKVAIYNKGDVPVAPVLRYIALDENGKALPDVTIHTALGSDRGQVIVPPGQAYDLLQFYGSAVENTVDVKVEVVRAAQVDYPAARVPPTATALTPSGSAKPDGARAKPVGRLKAVRLTNDNDVAITVRVAYVVWEAPTEEYLQPFVWSYLVGDLHIVPARGSMVAELEGESLALNLAHGETYPTSFVAFYSL